ncbi:acyltransferase family protein [Rothia sp. P13129]|uniref:acyltransferase family protein n=1 Tax=Rothia sp. P13129 TaxID=3402664 RepID=UPI003AD05622
MASKERRFRPEIQGLRAFAVTLVVAYHFWLGRVSGGVDVFLLISAFLMTLSFTRKLETGQPIGFKALKDYWARTFKRIMPLATATVLLVLMGTWFFLPAPRWQGIMDEAVSVVFYYENWWSINNLVDYYAADSSQASPLRHFWSLSVQGQIFLLWPLLFALSWVIYRMIGRRFARGILATLFGAVFLASLTYSVYYTHLDQQLAYFSTYTRLWEFALGSLIAIGLPYLRFPSTIKIMVGWLGLIAIVLCGLILDVEGNFPGYYALWPTLAAAAVLVSGDSASRWGVERLLSLKPLLWLATYSYGLYLIHWPLLVFYLYTVDQEKASTSAGIILFAVSLGCAWILTQANKKLLTCTQHFDGNARFSVLIVGCCMTAVLVSTTLWNVVLERAEQRLNAQPIVDNPGALALEAGFIYEGEENAGIRPSSADRFDDRPLYSTSCAPSLLETYHFEEWNCHQLTTSEEPTRRVIAVGNSHMDQWGDPLISLATQENWDLQFLQFNDCYLLDPARNTTNQGCQRWIENSQRYIDEQKPDLVITIGTISVYEGSGEYVPDGLEEFIEHLEHEGIEIIALRDNPRFESTHADCETRTHQLCTFDSELAQQPSPLEEYAAQYPNFGTVDMTDLICPNSECPSAVGNVYVYRDDSHLTQTFVVSAENFFIQRMLETLEGTEHADTVDESSVPEYSDT